MTCCSCCRPIRREDRVTPQGLHYKDYPHFVNADGQCIFSRYWEPKTTPRGLAMIIHAAGEHSGRYQGVAGVMTKHALFVFAHDHIGHGQSEGRRMYVSSFRDYIRDSLQHFDMMTNRFPNLKVFIFAHAMGGTIAISVANERQKHIAGVIFIAPLVILNPESATPARMFFAKVLYHLTPNLTLGYVDPRWLSRSQKEVKIFNNDPLNYHGPYRMRFTVQVLQAVAKLEKVVPTITWPMLILHGDADKLCDIRGSFLLYKLSASSDKTLKIFSKCFHLLHREVPNVTLEVFALIGKWIADRMPPVEQD
ncbi:monoglyceride lipase-like [Chiloscyllium plagiosum]|uniref:monoglyceride lipase-like n=1 Tax=Chiloscyllium plagiosum TaxID=36176 RepID=UPI001CB7D057|nr:monoglyceride lipase-like [Chiloscyllium plagiosum]